LSGGSLQRHGKKFVPWPLGHLKESWKLNGPELSMRSDAQVRKATLGDAPAEGRVSE